MIAYIYIYYIILYIIYIMRAYYGPLIITLPRKELKKQLSSRKLMASLREALSNVFIKSIYH